jgi:hypothetical protein
MSSRVYQMYQMHQAVTSGFAHQRSGPWVLSMHLYAKHASAGLAGAEHTTRACMHGSGVMALYTQIFT